MKNKQQPSQSVGEIINTGSSVHHQLLAEKLLKFVSPYRKKLIPLRCDQTEMRIWAPDESEEGKEEGEKVSKYKSFYQFLDLKECPAEIDLNNDELRTQLESLQKIMRANKLEVVSFCGIDDRTMYRFLTEIFLHKEMRGSLHDNPTRYIYEEFYPNDEYKIKCEVSDFLRSCFGLDLLFGDMQNFEDLLTNYNEIKYFKERFMEFDEVSIEFRSLTLEKYTSILKFEISYTGILNDQVLIERHNGVGTADLAKHGEYWSLEKIELPGL